MELLGIMTFAVLAIGFAVCILGFFSECGRYLVAGIIIVCLGFGSAIVCIIKCGESELNNGVDTSHTTIVSKQDDDIKSNDTKMIYTVVKF